VFSNDALHSSSIAIFFLIFTLKTKLKWVVRHAVVEEELLKVVKTMGLVAVVDAIN
jgi:hypothetical protein